MSPRVSIIITCYNQAHFLDKAVASALSQTFTDLECLIVDDGSTDETQKVAQAWIKTDARVQYFYKDNGGVSSARNFGFEKSQGEWIQFLDGDDWIHEDKTRFQLEQLSSGRYPEDTVFYSDYERVFLDQSFNITHRESKTIGSLDRQQLTSRLLTPDFLAESPFPILQQCLLMHRSVLAKKRFDEALRALQDRDFAIDLLVAGTQFVYTSIKGAYYTKHQSNRTNHWSYMKDYYLLLYETVYRKHPTLLRSNQIGLEYLMGEAIREQDKSHFQRLIRIVQFPVCLFEPKITFYNPLLLKFLYYVKPAIPNQLLYQKCRGPRSQWVLDKLQETFKLSQPSRVRS